MDDGDQFFKMRRALEGGGLPISDLETLAEAEALKQVLMEKVDEAFDSLSGQPRAWPDESETF